MDKSDWILLFLLACALLSVGSCTVYQVATAARAVVEARP